MQRISSGTFLVVCAIALVGCGSNGASAPTTTAPVTAPALVPTESDVTVAGSSGDAAAGDEPAVVEHALGAVDVVADPARVVALDRSLIDAALAGVVLLPVALVVGFLLGMTSFLHMRIAEFWASATEGEAA